MAERKLLLTHYKQKEAAFLIENDRLSQIWLGDDNKYHIGDIYVGRIKNIIKGMNAAFVELSPGQVGFLPFSRFNPKSILNRTDAEDWKCGDEILVQINKGALKTKEMTLTTDISFSGVYLVLIPFSHGIHYSRKFTPEQKDTMRNMISDSIVNLLGDIDVFLQHYGLIVRTNAFAAPEGAVAKELHDLFHQAVNVVSVADKRCVFSCLHKADSFYVRVVKNHFRPEITEMLTDDDKIYEMFSEYADAIRLYQDSRISMFALYGLEDKIKEALSKKVWLSCGGYLIIEPTEALTVIDVNSGKTGKSQNKLSSEEFHHRVNCCAVPEIMRQLRLRNLSGIIIVDMLKTGKDNAEILLSMMEREAAKDSVDTVIVGMTALGLVEITRKKTEASLYEKIKNIPDAKEHENET